jgi:hypothetical protein
VTPAASSADAEESDRASPVISCPASSSRGTTADPIQPDAPVMKMRMCDVSFSSGGVLPAPDL